MKKTKEKAEAEKQGQIDQRQQPESVQEGRGAAGRPRNTALRAGFTVPLGDQGGFGGRARRLERIHQSPRFRELLRERPGPCLWRRRVEWRGGYLQQSAKGAP